MRIKTLTKRFLAVACLLGIAPLSHATAHQLLLTNANIIDVNTGKITTNGFIGIDDNKISKIGKNHSNSSVTASHVVDLKGKYVIPGLWDMHIHIEGSDLVEDNKALFPVYIAHGITTVRDSASDLGEQVLAWRQDIADGSLLGPEIMTAGRKLEGIGSIWKGDLEIENEQQLAQMLDKLENYQVDFVKITENAMAGPLFLTSVKEAIKRGFKVSAHVPYDLSINQLANAGLSSIEHLSYMLRLGGDELSIIDKLGRGELTKKQARAIYVNQFDQQRAVNGYQQLASTGIALTPTLIGGKQLAYLDQDNHQSDEFLKYLTKRFTDNYQWRINRMASETPAQLAQRKATYQLLLRQLPLIHQAGIPILAGSDSAALNTFVYPALALHQELELFQQAGLNPLAILQSATINGAKFTNRAARLGDISQGKEADLVILNSNPLDNIQATQDIFAVINNGQYLNRKRLDEMLLRAEQNKLKLDRQRD